MSQRSVNPGKKIPATSIHPTACIGQLQDRNASRILHRPNSGGVGFADIMGMREYSMRIWLQPQKMTAFGISPEDVIQSLKQQNVEAAPGKIGESSGMRPQSLQYVVRYTGKYSTRDQAMAGNEAIFIFLVCLLFVYLLLAALIDTVLAGNPDLKIATERIRIAGAVAAQARGALLPQVNAGVTPSLRKFGLYTMDGAGNIVTEIKKRKLIPIDLPDLMLGMQQVGKRISGEN
ncbi:MAG: efflux RND transporter permease subunit [Chitinophagaceae bacterium]